MRSFWFWTQLSLSCLFRRLRIALSLFRTRAPYVAKGGRLLESFYLASSAGDESQAGWAEVQRGPWLLPSTVWATVKGVREDCRSLAGSKFILCAASRERAAVSRPDRLWLCSLQSGLLFIGIPALLIAVLRSLLRGSLLRERTCSKVPALAASVFSYRKYWGI